MSAPILLVGGGKMGGALLEGWVNLGLGQGGLAVVEPFDDAVSALRDRLGNKAAGVIFASFLDDLPPDFAPGIIVFAVKPQVMPDTLPAYAGLLAAGGVALSIAAGRTISFLEEALGGAAVIRAMPNTPAAVARGISVACANDKVTAGQRAACEALLGAVGEVAWVEDENLLDPVTAVSGSGPAYVFLLMECLAAAGEEAGLPPDLARKLADATVAGAGELARQSADSPSTLRENVTSPGGTTAAALEILRGPEGLQKLMSRAIQAATARSRELAG